MCVARFDMSKFQGKLTLRGKPVDHVSASLEMSSVVLICGPLFFFPLYTTRSGDTLNVEIDLF